MQFLQISLLILREPQSKRARFCLFYFFTYNRQRLLLRLWYFYILILIPFILDDYNIKTCYAHLHSANPMWLPKIKLEMDLTIGTTSKCCHIYNTFFYLAEYLEKFSALL
jgi:hypothetical protein